MRQDFESLFLVIALLSEGRHDVGGRALFERVFHLATLGQLLVVVFDRLQGFQLGLNVGSSRRYLRHLRNVDQFICRALRAASPVRSVFSALIIVVGHDVSVLSLLPALDFAVVCR